MKAKLHCYYSNMCKWDIGPSDEQNKPLLAKYLKIFIQLKIDSVIVIITLYHGAVKSSNLIGREVLIHFLEQQLLQ